MKSKLTKTQILFVTAILANLLLAGSCFFLWQKIGDTSDKINIRGQEVATQETQKSSSYQLAAFIKKEIDPASAQIAKYFIRGNNFIDFIKRIEMLAEKSHVDVEIKSVELPEALELNLNFEGSFSNSMYFIALVESLPINLQIDSVRIEQATNDDLWRGWAVITLPGSGEKNN